MTTQLIVNVEEEMRLAESMSMAVFLSLQQDQDQVRFMLLHGIQHSISRCRFLSIIDISTVYNSTVSIYQRQVTSTFIFILKVVLQILIIFIWIRIQIQQIFKILSDSDSDDERGKHTCDSTLFQGPLRANPLLGLRASALSIVPIEHIKNNPKN
jgi:hypothetical protein